MLTEIADLYSAFKECTRVSIDTRTLQKGDLFIAINGENFDGNQYAKKALELGAKYAVIDNEKYLAEGCIVVENSVSALQKLATYHRDKLSIQLIALTGSNGKTTTKELCAQLLAQKFNVQYTLGNLNNHLGVPLTLLSLKSETEIAIIEMGANHMKEIAFLTEIAKPECGLITNIGKAHIGEFGSFENIITGKTELYDYIKSHEGILFYNDENSILTDAKGDYESVVSYSDTLSGDFEVKVEQVEPNIIITLGDDPAKSLRIETELGGLHNIENLKAAITVGTFFGLDPKDIKSSLENFIMPKNRSQWLKTKRNQIFLDAYNANPTSMEKSIEYFSSIDGDKYYIIGEMLELGTYSRNEHEQLYTLLTNSKENFLLLGKGFEGIAPKDKYFLSTEELIQSGKLQEISEHKILMKASRGMKLEQLVEYL